MLWKLLIANVFWQSWAATLSAKFNIFTTHLDNVLHEKENIESSLSQKATSEAVSEALGSMHHWDG